jgi:hypothetical protein
MTSLVFQISAIVMASGSRMKKMSSRLLARLTQIKIRPTGGDGCGQLHERGDADGKKQQPDQQPAVERRELARFADVAVLVRQHRAEPLEDEVQVEQEQHAGEFQHHDGVGEESLFRQLVVPVDERAQAENDEREQLRAVERVPPRACAAVFHP